MGRPARKMVNLSIEETSGVDHPDKLNRHQITRRVFMNEVRTFEEIYPSIPAGSMLSAQVPHPYEHSYESASADKF